MSSPSPASEPIIDGYVSCISMSQVPSAGVVVRLGRQQPSDVRKRGIQRLLVGHGIGRIEIMLLC